MRVQAALDYRPKGRGRGCRPSGRWQSWSAGAGARARACLLLALGRVPRDLEGAVEWATHALDLARRLDDSETCVHALTNIAAPEFFVTWKEDGRARAKPRARPGSGAGRTVAAAFTFLVFGAARDRAYVLTESYAKAGIEYCSEHDLDGWRPFLVAMLGQVELSDGRWDAAAESATLVLADQGMGPATVSALVTVGLLRARRGDPGQWAALDDALELAERSGDLLRLGLVAAARAEAQWLEGRPDGVAETPIQRSSLPGGATIGGWLGELAYWRWRAGIEEETPPGAAEPYGLQIAGEWRRAADLWAELGCPTSTRSRSGTPTTTRRCSVSLEELQRLGARPAAAIVVRRLRSRGAQRAAARTAPGTRQNPANLTARELEILALVAGLRNTDIASSFSLPEDGRPPRLGDPA